MSPFDGQRKPANSCDAEGEEFRDTFVLRLYITGSSRNSTAAIVNTRKICETHLGGHYDLEIIDVREDPSLALSEQIVAAPTLIKTFPLPSCRFIGDMSQTQRILDKLGVGAGGASAA